MIGCTPAAERAISRNAAAHQIKAVRPDLPVIVVSALGETEDKVELLDMGAHALAADTHGEVLVQRLPVVRDEKGEPRAVTRLDLIARLRSPPAPDGGGVEVVRGRDGAREAFLIDGGPVFQRQAAGLRHGA